ncbi:MAG: metallophosphoesterase [Candidatus Pacearchaeota archaeon]
MKKKKKSDSTSSHTLRHGTTGMTRILAVGDLHGDRRLIDGLAKKAKDENVDLVILAGDLTFAETSTENIVGPFLKAGKEVLIIPGNHESPATTEFLSKKYLDTTHLHGNHFIKGNLGIFGAGGADIGVYQIDDSEILKLLGKSHDKVKSLDKKLMVTHIHPAGTNSEFSGFKGSKAVRKAIDKFQPDVAVFAHIHEAAGTEDKIGKTRAINVSRKGKVFEV